MIILMFLTVLMLILDIFFSITYLMGYNFYKKMCDYLCYLTNNEKFYKQLIPILYITFHIPILNIYVLIGIFCIYIGSKLMKNVHYIIIKLMNFLQLIHLKNSQKLKEKDNICE